LQPSSASAATLFVEVTVEQVGHGPVDMAPVRGDLGDAGS